MAIMVVVFLGGRVCHEVRYKRGGLIQNGSTWNGGLSRGAVDLGCSTSVFPALTVVVLHGFV